MYCQSDCGKWYIKALNVDFIKQPVLGTLEIAVRTDGRFGVADPLLWPQTYCPEKPHLAMIPCRPGTGHPADLLWNSLELNDFVRVDDNPQATHYGRVRDTVMAQMLDVDLVLSRCVDPFRKTAEPALLAQLDRLEYAWKAALELVRMPFTYRDSVQMWSHLHRTWADCWAFVNYHQALAQSLSRSLPDAAALKPHSGLGNGVMGVFVSDPSVAQRMYLAGIPVWLLQTSSNLSGLPKQVPPQIPGDVVVTISDATLVTSHLQETQHLSGEHVHTIWEQSCRLVDLEHTPLPADHRLRSNLPGPSTGFGLEATAAESRGTH